ncbi:MAG: hypothetical protein GX557_05405, partial [Chloroflexi bacterium]|nr:hypothetical protein [Chloroflexota bacterium]
PLVEYPAIRSVYQLYGAAERVAQLQIDAPHNYNAASRAAVYRWFARWFLGNEALGEGVEHDFTVEPDERMRVFPGAELPTEARTPAQVEHEFVARAEQRLAALIPERRQDLERLRQVTEPRLRETLEAAWPDPAAVLAIEAEATIGPAGRQIPLTLARRGVAERIRGTLYLPTEGTAQRYALLVHGAGRTALEDRYGQAGEAVVALRDAGWGVLTIDAFYTGDVPPNAVPWRRDWFWLTLNPTLVGQRVQDILTALAWLDGRSSGDELALVGLGAAGSWGMWAGALCPRDLRLALDLDGLDTQEDASYLGELYAPNLRAYGDLRAAGALLAPRALTLGGAQRCALHWLESAYRAAGAVDRLQVIAALSPDELRRLGAGR